MCKYSDNFSKTFHFFHFVLQAQFWNYLLILIIFAKKLY